MKSYSNLDNDRENNYNSRKNEHFENRILNPENGIKSNDKNKK